VKRDDSKYDRKLLFTTIGLVLIGLIMVASASQIIGHDKWSSSFFFVQRHAIRILIGFLALFVFSKIPYTVYRRLSFFIILASFILLAAIFMWGREVRSATRWLPIFKHVFQPVELAKVALVIYLATKIADLGSRIKRFKEGFVPLVSVVVVMALLVALQPNVSNATLIIIVSFVIIFVGGGKLSHITVSMLGLIAAGAPLIYRIGVVQERVHAFIDKSSFAKTTSFQVNQSLIAFGSGFIFGKGPGRGHQKFNFLPDPHTDFIYSIIGEELGIIGTITVLALFAYFLRRALKIARNAPDRFAFLLAYGLGILIFTTAAINISMVLGLIPTAGMPLPFISYGGSSLLASMVSVGILINISSKGHNAKSGGTLRITTRKRKNVYARRRLVSQKASS